MVESELKRVCALLEVSNDVPYTLLLFDDFAEARALLKLPEPFEGITWGTTVATRFDNDQGTKHEMIHCVANAAIGPAANTALAEGLAQALLETIHGFRLHVPAKYHRLKGRLPALQEILGASDFAAWDTAHPGVHSYDIVGSWMRFLLEARGAEKLKRYYRSGQVEDVYGVELAVLEKEWQAALDKFDLRPEEKAVLASRIDRVDTPITLVAGDSLGFDGGQVATGSAGQARLSYHWRKNNVELAGASGPELGFNGLTTNDSGVYEVTVRDDRGATIGAKTWELVVIDPARLAPAARP